MTEKELEKLFKSKLNNREFAFNPANWEAMEAILDSEPKPAGAFYWRSVLAVLLFGVAIWSFIAFAPAVAENKEVNNTEILEPHKIEEAQKEILPEDLINEAVPESPAEQVAEQPAVVAQESVAANQVSQVEETYVAKVEEAQELVQSSEDVATTPMEEGQTKKVEQVEATPILPLSHKGFVYKSEIPQSLMEVSPGGHFTPEAFKKFDTKSSFYLEAAPIFSGSYNANNVGVGWKVGLGWERAIGSRFQFNAGLGYTVQNGVGIENNSDSVFYNFGKEVVETQEINKRLDYIELPVSVGYKLNEKNMLSLGMYAGYLVNVSREVDKETSGFKSETEYESSKENGYQEDFKRMDYGLEFGYRYRLTPALSVGLHYNLGLVDITKNTQGDYLQRHTNQNTRVVFRYRFL